MVKSKSLWDRFLILIQRKVRSKSLNRRTTMYCNHYKHKSTKRNIPHFAKKNRISRKSIEKCKNDATDDECWNRFDSLNDFFIRKKTNIPKYSSDVYNIYSPADSYVFYLDNFTLKDRLWIKSKLFTVEKLFGTNFIPSQYQILIFRLEVFHYHWFHSPITGLIDSITVMGDDYYSVDPLIVNSDINVFNENKRVNFSIRNHLDQNILMSVIGANCVGTIRITNKNIVDVYNNLYNTEYTSITDKELQNNPISYTQIPILAKQELGHFEFGGSTVIVLCPKNYKMIDVIKRNSNDKNEETEVRIGDTILY